MASEFFSVVVVVDDDDDDGRVRKKTYFALMYLASWNS